jgi:3-oxoacyl-[acyl-carrier-protein] synthase-3
MKYGFECLVYDMPDNKVMVENLAKEAGYGDDMLTRLHDNGLRTVPVNQSRPLDYLVNKAVGKLISRIPDLAERTYGIMLAHSLPILAPTCIPFLSLCIKGYKMDNKKRVAITGQPCCILHKAVQTSICWLKDQPLGSGILLIGADQAYSAEERIFFGSAMGDVAVAGFITNNADRNIILSSVSETDIIAYEGEMSPREDIEKFRESNPMFIRHAIESALKEANLTLSEIKYIIPHTPYKMIWDVMSQLLRYPRSSILDKYIEDTGHLNSNDAFCHYVRACDEKLIVPGDTVLLVNPGFGGTRGCTVIKA